MKAITLTQPWATLVVLGEKKLETRSWSTKYRGRILIHAAKGFPAWAKKICDTEPFKSSLAKHGYKSYADLPTQAIVGSCSILGTRLITSSSIEDLTIKEKAFGDYADGRFMWDLNEPTRFEIKNVNGKLSIWEYTDELINE